MKLNEAIEITFMKRNKISSVQNIRIIKFKSLGTLLLVFFLFPEIILSQDSLLRYQDAIAISLNANYNIQIAQNRFIQAANLNTPGNAGMLPKVDVNGAYTKSSNSLNQKYNTGNEVKRDASEATNTSADIGAVWTIFDGLKMFSTKEKLMEQSNLFNDQFKIQLEELMLEVVDGYYILVKQKQLLKSMKDEIKFAEERKKIAERKLTNGSGSRLDLLQANTELNRQRVVEMNIQSEINSARIHLNKLLQRPVETNFTIEDTVIITYNKSLDEIKKTVYETNTLLNYYKRNRRIAELELKETKALRMPVISLNAHYAYSKNTNEAGFLLFNQSNGFNYGATATLPLFRGFSINKQIRNSRLEVLNSELAFKSATDDVNAELYTIWLTFSKAMEILRVEEQNIVFAREVLTVSQERFRVGLSSNVEILDAQRTYEESMTRLATARYTAKISEARLMKVNGELIVFGSLVKE